MRNENLVFKTALYLPVLLITVISLFPFYVMLIMGTYYNEDLFTGLKLLPGNYLLQNMKTVFAKDILLFYKNSIYISFFAAAGAAMISALAGFAFSKYDFKLKKVLFIFVLGTMMIPPQLGLIGFTVEMKWLNIINTHLPLILPPMANAFGVFWMTKFIGSAIPTELLDSATVDGCSHYGLFSRIVLPNLKSGLLTIFLIVFLSTWNNFLIPLIIINKDSLYTITMGICLLGNMFRTDYAARILGLSFTVIPIIIIFTIMSKYFTQGLMAGSVKG